MSDIKKLIIQLVEKSEDKELLFIIFAMLAR